MAMAVAIDTARLALYCIPITQERLDRKIGGQRRFQIHRVSVHVTIPFPASEIWRQSHSALHNRRNFHDSLPKQEALDWPADPDDDLSDAEVLHHLHQQAASVPLLSSVNSQMDHGNARTTTLIGSALSASISAATQGRPLSSFHRHSYRESCLAYWKSDSEGLVEHRVNSTGLFPSGSGIQDPRVLKFIFPLPYTDGSIIWEEPPRDMGLVFWQVQLDVVDLFSRRTLPSSRPGKRRRTAFNQFLQVSHSPVVEDTSRGNPQVRHARRFNGVRHRPDRKIWVAEMKPPKHKTKQDFGNFKSEAQAARAVDAAFHHYGRPELLNFRDTSLQFLSTRPTAPPELDEKAKVRFVKEEAKLLLAAMAASQLHSTPSATNSLQILELSASPRRCPSSQFRSLSEISSPFSCSGPHEVDAAVSQSQEWLDLDSIFDISSAGVQANLETLTSKQIAEQGWDGAGGLSTLAATPDVVNPSASEFQSQWLDTLTRSPPAPMDWRSPSPSHFEEAIAYALLEQPSI